MTASAVRRSSWMTLAASLLLASCATVKPGAEPEPLVIRLGSTPGNPAESVLKYAGDPAPSGQAEFVTVTDGAGNTLFEAAIPPERQLTVPMPSDGRLIVSTRWTDGRTRQEMSLPAQKVGKVTLALNESTLLYSVAAPADTDTAGPARPTPEEVTIEDGEGQILYWGLHHEELEVDATDDTLVCTINWSDGKTSRQNISLTDKQVFQDEWGEYVVFQWDDLSRQYGLRTRAEPKFLRDLRAALLELEAGTFGDEPPTAGVVTGNDDPLLKGADGIDYQGINLGLTFGKWQRYVPSIELGLVRGDGDASRELAGANSGWVFQGGLSPGGSPGLASAGGTRASLGTDYQRQNFSLTLSDKFRLMEASQASIDYSFLLTRSVRDYRSELALLAFPDVTGTDRQEITEYDVGLGIGLRGRHTLPNKWAFSGLVGLDAMYYRGKYEGDHRYECGVCAPADQQFTQSTSDRNDGFTLGARLTARASYRVRTNSEVYLGLNYRYQGAVPALQNRIAPGDPEPHLDTGRLDWRSLRIGFNHKY